MREKAGPVGFEPTSSAPKAKRISELPHGPVIVIDPAYNIFSRDAQCLCVRILMRMYATMKIKNATPSRPSGSSTIAGIAHHRPSLGKKIRPE